MTARVDRMAPVIGPARSVYIGRPYTGGIAQGHVDLISHIAGHQLSTFLDVGFGMTESMVSATWRTLVRAGPNTRAVVLQFVVMGYQGGGAPGARSLTVTSSETESPIVWHQDIATVTDLGDLRNPSNVRFIVPVTAGALNEISWTVSNLRLHAVTGWEVPRAQLTGTHEHLDASFASGFITDNQSASNPRGYRELINQVSLARTNMRRHLVNLPMRLGLGTGGAPGVAYLIGSAAAGDGIRIYGRDVRGGAGATIPVRCKVYIESITAANTFSINVIFPGGTTAVIAGINAVGWWPNAGGALVDPGTSATMAFAGDLCKVTFQRVIGAGSLELSSLCVYEDT